MYEDTREPGVGKVFVGGYMLVVATPLQILQAVREAGLVDIMRIYEAPDIDGIWYYGHINPCFLDD